MRRLYAFVALLGLAAFTPVFPSWVLLNRGALDPPACVPSTAINWDFTTGSLPGAITFTRASSATYVNVSGTLTTASTNAARFNYDANYPVGGTPSLTGPYLLYEATATNLLTQSNNFSTPPGDWFGLSAPIVTAAAATSPDGTSNASRLQILISSFGGIAEAFTFSNIAYNFSGWSKANGGNSYTLGVQGTFSSGKTAAANWSRQAFTRTASAASSNVQVASNGSPAVDIFIYGYQLETGSTSTSYIATTTAQVTRAADVASFAVPSCVGHLTVTFDDNSTQSIVAASPLTTTFNRPNIKTIVGAI